MQVSINQSTQHYVRKTKSQEPLQLAFWTTCAWFVYFSLFNAFVSHAIKLLTYSRVFSVYLTLTWASVTACVESLPIPAADHSHFLFSAAAQAIEEP